MPATLKRQPEMNNELTRIYREIRSRSRHYNATDAIRSARRHIAGPLAEYQAKLAAWQAEPDKRRYAPGGSANRPKYPVLYSPRPLIDMREVEKPRHVESWYADGQYDAVFEPRVWRLSNGKLATGYVCDSWDFAWIDQSTTWDADDERGAWNEAERTARRDAENSRDEDQRQRAELEREDARGAMAILRQRYAQAASEYRALRSHTDAGLFPVACSTIRNNLERIAEDFREALRVVIA